MADDLPEPQTAEDPSEAKVRPFGSSKRAVTAYLDERLGRTASDDTDAAAEDPDRAEIRKSLVSAVATIVGEDGVCAKADTHDGSPILVAARGGSLWLVSHVPGMADDDLGTVEAQRLGSLPAAEIVQTVSIQAGGPKTIEFRHERLPGGSLSFDASRLRRDAADELVGQLERIAA